MHKLPDWAQRLDALVAQAQRRPFAWGSFDCCLWAADAVLAQTGEDPAADLRGTYADAAGAARVLRAQGGLRGVATRGGEPIAPLMARTGDVGLLRSNGRPLLAVCGHDHWLVVMADGLTVRAYRDAAMAWRVGRG